MVLSIQRSKELEDFIIKKIEERFIAQGHKLTGALIEKAKWETVHYVKGISMNLYMSGYSEFLDKGVPASNIKFTLGSGAGKSKYIEGLLGYVRKRKGLSGKPALRVAFAIAITQKEEGMPTMNSLRHSSTGRRTGLIADTIKEEGGVILAMAKSVFAKTIAVGLQQHFRDQVQIFRT